jgi:hypothetical protein
MALSRENKAFLFSLGGLLVFLFILGRVLSSPSSQSTDKAGAEERARQARVRANAAENLSWAGPPTPLPTPIESPAVRKAREKEEAKKAREEAKAAAREVERKRQDGIGARRLLAEILEKGMLAQGLDVHAEAVGKERKQLRITYILANRPFTFREVHDKEFMETIRAAGFESLYFSNGYDFAESYNLK